MSANDASGSEDLVDVLEMVKSGMVNLGGKYAVELILRLAKAESELALCKKREWISIKERMPKKFEHVMVYLKPVPLGPDWYPRTNYTLGWHKRGIWFGTFINVETGLVEKGEIPEDLVTHWQSLLDPPRTEPIAGDQNG